MINSSSKVIGAKAPVAPRIEWAWFRVRQACRRSVVLAVSAIYAALRLPRVCLSRTSRRGNWIVLYYHSVKDKDRQRFAAQVALIAKHSKVVPASYQGYPIPGERLVSLTFDDAFVSVARNALPAIAQEMCHMTIFVPTKYLGRSPEWVANSLHEDTDEKIMSAVELCSLPPDLVAFGSHSVTHTRFAALTAEERRKELVESKSRMEEILQRPVTMFSYPYGEGLPGDVELATAAGYDHVFTNVPEVASESRVPYQYGRVPASATDTRLEMILKLNGAYGWLPRAIRVKRVLRAFIRKELAVILQTFSSATHT
ncbi:MAG TPA: polysaccharide deacetylase family protein [Acidobacteriaceae bacterium]|nr:polysaccharide deacetylase family protein [Acidobacteriaceae bacterium]